MHDDEEEGGADFFDGLGAGWGDGRPLTGEQRLLAAVLRDALQNLTRAPHCFRHKGALAWLVGRYPCGCRYEDEAVSVELVADAFGCDADWLRRAALDRVGLLERRRRKARQRTGDCRQLWLPCVKPPRRRRTAA